MMLSTSFAEHPDVDSEELRECRNLCNLARRSSVVGLTSRLQPRCAHDCSGRRRLQAVLGVAYLPVPSEPGYFSSVDVDALGIEPVSELSIQALLEGDRVARECAHPTVSISV